MDLEVGEDITQQIGAVEEATDAVRRAICSSRGRRTIGYE